MHFIRGLSADMDDLTTEKGRKEAESFWKHFLWSVEKGYYEPYTPIGTTVPVPVTVPEEIPGGKAGNVTISEKTA